MVVGACSFPFLGDSRLPLRFFHPLFQGAYASLLSRGLAPGFRLQLGLGSGLPCGQQVFEFDVDLGIGLFERLPEIHPVAGAQGGESGVRQGSFPQGVAFVDPEFSLLEFPLGARRAFLLGGLLSPFEIGRGDERV